MHEFERKEMYFMTSFLLPWLQQKWLLYVVHIVHRTTTFFFRNTRCVPIVVFLLGLCTFLPFCLNISIIWAFYFFLVNNIFHLKLNYTRLDGIFIFMYMCAHNYGSGVNHSFSFEIFEVLRLIK